MYNYSFDNFIVSACNNRARNACYTFAETAGEKNNPLIVYGNIGTGKTHLAIATFALLKEEHPEYKVLYVTAEEFANEVIDSMRSINNAKEMNCFRERYRQIDILIFDDLDWLQNKEATCSELFFTVDKLLEDGKKIIFTSSKGISSLFQDSERIKSRIESYFQVSINGPDDHLIGEVMKSFNLEQRLDDEVKEYIKRKCENSIRKLQGIFRTLAVNIESSGVEKITLDQIEEIVDGDISHKYRINI